MNALAKLMNSILFQTDHSDSDSDSESESGSGSGSEYNSSLAIGKFMNNLYTQENMFETETFETETNTELSDSYSEYHRPRIVSLEGNIGAGKTTIMDTLKKNTQMILVSSLSRNLCKCGRKFAINREKT